MLEIIIWTCHGNTRRISYRAGHWHNRGRSGSITAPILILFFHQSATDAVTTALVFGTVVKLIATPIYLSRGQVNFRVLKFMAFGGLPAVVIGSLVLNRSIKKP